MKYYHQLSDAEIQELIDKKVTYGELEKLHPQPVWCHYPEATSGMMGCWSLIMKRNDVNREYCKDCDCYEKTC